MRKTLLVVLSLIALSCDSNDKDTTMTSVATMLIAKGNLFGAGHEGISLQNLVIQDQTNWSDLIALMNTVNTVSDSFTETDINFSEYTVIAVFDDVKANGGHSIDLDVMTDFGTIVVDVTHNAPQGNATTVITQPFHIIKIEKSDLPILFQ